MGTDVVNSSSAGSYCSIGTFSTLVLDVDLDDPGQLETVSIHRNRLALDELKKHRHVAEDYVLTQQPLDEPEERQMALFTPFR